MSTIVESTFLSIHKPICASFVIWILCLIHAILAPFTKVEESFSIQAIHDYLFLSKLSLSPLQLYNKTSLNNNNNIQIDDTQSWDHEHFPGNEKFFTNNL